MTNPLIFERIYCEKWTIEGGSGFKVRTRIKDDLIISKKELVKLSEKNDIQIKINQNILNTNKKKGEEEEQEEPLIKKFRRMYLIRTYLGGLRVSNFSFSLIGKRIPTEVFAKLWEEQEIRIQIKVGAWKKLKEIKKGRAPKENNKTREIDLKRAKKELEKRGLKGKELKKAMKKLEEVA